MNLFRTITGLALLILTVGRTPADPGKLALPPSTQEAMTEWFSPDLGSQAQVPVSIQELGAIEKGQVEAIGTAVWSAYAASPAGDRLKRLLPEPVKLTGNAEPTGQRHDLPTGDKIMPFYFLGKGNLSGPRALFIALHGGGSAGGNARSAHGWEVNTREWNTQARLAATLYPDHALYFVPRMADDNDGRWYFDYCQDAYDQVIRAALLHHQVDPNRVYLIGISEGAYTAYRLGAFMADRWAGTGSMAGGDPPENAPPENLRNTAFRADIGEHDTMFDRIGLNRRYGEALGRLRQEDPDGFVHHVEIQSGRGHAIDYRPCPEWIFQHTRDPHPTRVRWIVNRLHGRMKRQWYWLAMDAQPDTLPVVVDARVDRARQTVHLAIHTVDAVRGRAEANDLEMRVYLDDRMIDLDQPVRIIRNGRTIFEDLVPRRLDVLMRSLAERGDPFYMFPAEVVIEHGQDFIANP